MLNLEFRRVYSTSIKKKRPLKEPYELTTQEELDVLLGQQDAKMQAFNDARAVAEKQKAKDKDKAKDDFHKIDLSVFSKPQEKELKKIIKFITNN